MQPTSVLAHEQHESSGTAETNRKLVHYCVAMWDGVTACELFSEAVNANYTITRHEISRRLPELRAAGLVHNGEKRKCRIKGNLQLTWFYGKGPDADISTTLATQRVLTSKTTRKPMAVTYVSKAGKHFCDNVVANVMAETPNITPISGDVRVFIDLWPPDKRKRDIDNVIKPLFDALTAARVWNDDSQIVEMTVKKRTTNCGHKGGAVLITIVEMCE